MTKITDTLSLPGEPLSSKDYIKLEKCFISEEMALQAKFRRVSSTEGGAIVGRNGKADYSGTIIPYVWPGEDHIREYRLRRDNPELEHCADGTTKEIAKYLSPPGKGSLLYFVPETPAQWLQDTQLPIVLTEGEKKTIALYQLAHYKIASHTPHFLPLGMPGVWNWRGKIGKIQGPKGEWRDIKGPIPDLDRINWTGRKAIIIFDSNTATNPSVKQARSRLAKELKKRGAKVYYVNLPQIEGINGVDDLLNTNGSEYVLNLINKAQCAEVSLPTGFKLSDSGVYAVDPTGEHEDIWICSPLRIVASTRNHNSENWGQLLLFQDKDGKEHSWLMPMAMLAGDGNEYRQQLLNMGLSIAPGRKARELLTIYIQTAKPEAKVRCVDRIGWHDKAFILPDETFGDELDEQILFQTSLNTKHNLSISGSLKEWQDSIGQLCSNNKLLLFAVSCAFAGPLLTLAGESGGGGFHLYGLSSTGKTTALLVAGSIWGGGQNGYVQTWRTTANGLEAVAELYNHGLLCLDEIGQCDPYEVGEVAYLLANGNGKLRMSKSINARKKLEWQLIFLSSGETTLQAHQDISGKRSYGGQDVRLVNIEANAGVNMGLFEDLHNFKSPAELSRYLSKASRQFYGTPIREFLSVLVHNREEIEELIHNTCEEFIKLNVLPNASGEVYRVASRFALVGIAGMIASLYGVTGWETGEALRAADELFHIWLANRGTTGASDIEIAINQVRSFIEVHGASRFQSIEEQNLKINNRAGYKRLVGEETQYLVFAETFKREVCKGLDYSMVAKLLAERGYLDTEQNSDRLTIRYKVSDGQKRFYAINSKIFS